MSAFIQSSCTINITEEHRTINTADKGFQVTSLLLDLERFPCLGLLLVLHLSTKSFRPALDPSLALFNWRSFDCELKYGREFEHSQLSGLSWNQSLVCQSRRCEGDLLKLGLVDEGSPFPWADRCSLLRNRDLSRVALSEMQHVYATLLQNASLKTTGSKFQKLWSLLNNFLNSFCPADLRKCLRSGVLALRGIVSGSF